MDNKKCSECSSIKIHQGGEYAMGLARSGFVKKPNTQPNKCRDCGHKWSHQI